MEVEAQEPEDEAMIKTLDQMRSRGIKLLYGRWLIEGAPRVLLFDTGSAYQHLDEWKGDLWNLAGIPTPPNDHETNETIVFGYLVAWFLGEVSVFSVVHFLRLVLPLHIHVPLSYISSSFPQWTTLCLLWSIFISMSI